MLNKNMMIKIKEKCFEIKRKYIKVSNLNAAKVFVILFALLFILYYGVFGAIFNSDIRKNVNVKLREFGGLKTLGVASYIIDREVQDNLWTPSLPFFFPTYFLDNLPNFQLGVMKANSIIVDSLASFAKSDKKLFEASELLAYDGKIWMFEKGGVLPVPSAASQYKKSRVLIKKSSPLANGLALDKFSFLYLINTIDKSLSISLNKIDKANIEDENIDDVFYYNQGKAYAYLLFLKAMSHDYKNVLIETNLYEPITSVIKSLENACKVSPTIVKNANRSSSSANHLYNLGYYLQKALLKLEVIKEGLQ